MPRISISGDTSQNLSKAAPLRVPSIKPTAVLVLTYMMSNIASPIVSIRRRLPRNDSFTRSSFPAPRFCAPILRHERGDRGAAAVAERVGKALDARVFARCGITPNLKFSTMDSLATYSMVVAGLGLAMNNALNGRAFAGGVRILPLDPPQIVEIGAATLPDLSPAARTFLDFLEPHLVEFLSEKS